MIRRILAILVASWAFTQAASALPTIKLIEHGLGTTNGGEFIFETYDVPGYPDGTEIISYCLETDELMAYGETYDVIISNEAIMGGANDDPAGPLGGDLLDPMTAYLFYHYAIGDLTGWDGDDASADGLQKAIWYIEDEIEYGGLDAKGIAFYDLAVANVGGDEGWQGLGPVRVMNLYEAGYRGDPAYLKQDQLILVPAPGALVLGCIGAVLTRSLRKRRTF